jgi:membrane dipeptidase
MKIYPVFDGHNDVFSALYLPEYAKGRTLFEESGIGHIDIPRAKKGGMVGGFFSICTPPPNSTPENDPYRGLELTADGYRLIYPPSLDFDYSRKFTDSVIDFAYSLEKQSNGDLSIVRNYSELEQSLRRKSIAAILHIEGAEPMSGDLSNLEYYYGNGIRSLGLVWSRPNVFGFGVPYRHPSSPDTGPGLTAAGKKLVTACNELKIVVDLAHINEKGFWDVVSITKHPLVVSHTAAHTLCPASRNLTDRQIDAIADSGGIIGVWFEPLHINYRADKDRKPVSDVPAIEIARHIDYIARRVGIEYVAIGSDFDGADMPKEICDVSRLPVLFDNLAKLEYSETDLEKIAMKNWLRVIKDIWLE